MYTNLCVSPAIVGQRTFSPVIVIPRSGSVPGLIKNREVSGKYVG
jgi:hypothetical protein